MKRVLAAFLAICIAPAALAESNRFQGCLYDAISPTLSVLGSAKLYRIDATEEVKGRIAYEFYKYEEDTGVAPLAGWIEFDGVVVKKCPADPFLDPATGGDSDNYGCMRIEKVRYFRPGKLASALGCPERDDQEVDLWDMMKE